MRRRSSWHAYSCCPSSTSTSHRHVPHEEAVGEKSCNENPVSKYVYQATDHGYSARDEDSYALTDQAVLVVSAGPAGRQLERVVLGPR